MHARRDATYIRGRILPAFELAETEPDPDERRRRQLNFVVVGGGPTGVEMAGSIAELAKRALASDSGDDVVQTLIQHDRR